jgi:hypothetical protein
MIRHEPCIRHDPCIRQVRAAQDASPSKKQTVGIVIPHIRPIGILHALAAGMMDIVETIEKGPTFVTARPSIFDLNTTLATESVFRLFFQRTLGLPHVF